MKKITSLSHPLVKHLVKLRKERSYREEKNALILAGNKIAREVSEKKVRIKNFIIVENSPFQMGESPIIVTKEIMKKITGLVSPEDLALEIEIPEKKAIKDEKYLLVLDKISDPGNLGTLIRTAHGLNFDGVVLTENTVDPYNDKALRAAKGSSFSLPLFFLSTKELEDLALKKKYNLFLADLNGKKPEDLSFLPPLMLILSSESKGPMSWTKKIMNKVTIPMKKDLDSLNVAISGAILMYLMRKP